MLDRLELFHGELTPSVGHVYARLPRPADGAIWRIGGQVRGPVSRFGATLMSSARLRELPPSETLLAQGLVTDPCGWTSDFPARYEVEIELYRNDDLTERTTREFIFRRFGSNSGRFLCEGKRWVLRGVTADTIATISLDQWRDTGTCALLNHDREVFSEAISHGVWTVSRGAMSNESPLRIAPHAELEEVSDSGRFANRVWIQELQSNDEAIHRIASAIFVRAENIPAILERFGEDRPAIVAFRRAEFLELTSAREACDRLQADLAPLGQFAGYVV